MAGSDKLDGKRALAIGGGGAGIGRAIVRACAAAGAGVAVADLDAARATEAADELRAAGRAAHALSGDVRPHTQLEDLITDAAVRLGGLDTLITVVGGQVAFVAGRPGVHAGRAFTQDDGDWLHPAWVTDQFQRLTAEAGLPPIRPHDLRHGAATLALAAGADMKVVQEMLGHSSITITSDTYTSVLPEVARKAAEDAAALIPRQDRRTAGLTSGSRGAVARPTNAETPHPAKPSRALKARSDG